MNVIVIGSTGLCGSSFSRKSIQSTDVKQVWSFSRRDIPKDIGNPEKSKKIVSTNTEKWKEDFPGDASVMFSGIATTRAAAGGLDKQRSIDYDLQVSLAKAAKERGCKSFVLVSSAGASSDSRLGYFKMKGDIEQAITELNFEKTLILRPGPSLGDRSKPLQGIGASFVMTVMPCFHKTFLQSSAKYPVYGYEVADSTFKFLEELPNGVHIIDSHELVSGQLDAQKQK